jgi:hypothetical protein
MILTCFREAITSEKKIMFFTIGKKYEFEESIDPEGWETKDDNGNKEVFFDLSVMFANVDIDYFKCVGCDRFREELNEFDLCPRCADRLEQLRKDIQETQDSDLRQ